MSEKNRNDTRENRNRGLPACNADDEEVIFYTTCIIIKFMASA